MKITRKSAADALVFAEVEFREPTVADMLQAERLAGKGEGIEYLVALVSLVATFDGRQLVPEDLRRMSLPDFLQLSQEIGLAALPESDALSSTSPAKADLASTTSKK